MNTYDYVVIGAGSSGCVVANRLTEDPDVSVLLLEAGATDELPAIDDPRAFAQLFKTAVDWAYVTAPEPELNGTIPRLAPGQGPGRHQRDQRDDLPSREPRGLRQLGEPGQPGVGDMRTCFRTSRSRNETLAARQIGTGASGLLDVTDPAAPHPYSLAFVDAAVELGHARNPDFNGARQDGAGLWQRTIKDGTRSSTARAFLHPALARSNLLVLTGAEATRIVFEGRRATGVRYVGKWNHGGGIGAG